MSKADSQPNDTEVDSSQELPVLAKPISDLQHYEEINECNHILKKQVQLLERKLESEMNKAVQLSRLETKTV